MLPVPPHRFSELGASRGVIATSRGGNAGGEDDAARSASLHGTSSYIAHVRNLHSVSDHASRCAPTHAGGTHSLTPQLCTHLQRGAGNPARQGTTECPLSALRARLPHPGGRSDLQKLARSADNRRKSPRREGTPHPAASRNAQRQDPAIPNRMSSSGLSGPAPSRCARAFVACGGSDASSLVETTARSLLGQ